MKKLRRRRYFELFMVVAVAALVAAAPAGALAAGEESGSGSSAGETGTEPSSGSTEAAPPAPPEEASSTGAAPASAGWVPQGAGTETSSHGGASTRRGSSLGVGVSSKQAGSTSEESSYSGGDSSGSSDYYEPESSTPSTVEEPAVSKPRVASPVSSVEPQAAETAPDQGGHAAVAVAIPVALQKSPQAADTSSAPLPAPVASMRDLTASGSGGLLLAVLIVCGLILVYAGVQLLFGPFEPDFFRSGPFRRVRRALSRV
jgi:hypothetical protein